MKNAELRKTFILIFLAAILTFLFELPGEAQSSRPPTSVGRRIDEMNRQSEEFERDKLNRELKGRKNSPENSKQTQILRAEIKEDLENIQSAYNKIILSLQADGGPKRDFIIETADNIKKHAERLVKNLSLPEPDKTETQPAAEENLENRRKSLLALCRHIFNFVTNPIFEAPTVLDVKQAGKARSDLEKIILLSEKIKETAASESQETNL